MAVTQIRGNTQILADTITNTQISSSAAIATSKLADGANFIQRTGTVAFTADQSMGGFKLTNLAAPASANDAATKAYVDAITVGLDFKESVRATTTANITLSGIQTIDGVSLVAGNRVLVKNQTTASENGIYVVAAGAWSRATDADSSPEVTSGLFTFVEEGTNFADTSFVLTTNNPITLGTTALTFTQFSGAGSISAANLGTGVGTYDSVSGTTLRFRSIKQQPAGKVTVALSGSDIQLDIGAGTLVNADISASAAIARSKIAAGTVNHVVVNDGAGNLSSVAVLPISQGGTNSSAALSNNRIIISSAGALVESAAITANRALASNASGIPVATSVTDTELGYVSGVTSAIQTQLNNKINSADFIVRETPTGLVNGSNTTFTLAFTPVAGKEQVFLNGILQEPGAGNDYTISGATITYLTAPVTGDKIRVSYLK